jgi:hypothetical protein
VQTRWAIVAGLAAGIAVAWWFSRESPDTADARRAHAEQAAASDGNARPVLYRWTDDAGVLQVTQDPPSRGRRYETVDIQPRDGIEVDGRRP